MSVDKFGRTGTNYTSGVHHVGNFLPLTGGRLGGTLTMGANNIQFSTGDIHSTEDLSFLINSETKMVLRPNGVDVCDAKIRNVALPTLAADAAMLIPKCIHLLVDFFLSLEEVCLAIYQLDQTTLSSAQEIF